MTKYIGKCWYCEFVVEGNDHKTVRDTLRDHILDKHEEDVRKIWENDWRMRRARRTKSLKWLVGWLLSIMGPIQER